MRHERPDPVCYSMSVAQSGPFHFMTLFLETETVLTEQVLESGAFDVAQANASAQELKLLSTAESVHPLAFFPPGDFRYFSVPLGEFNLSFARKNGRLWGYVDSGGLSLDALLEGKNPEKNEAALIPVTDDGHGLLFVNTGTGEDSLVRLRLDGRLVKASLGLKGVFVADMGSLRPGRPDPLIIPPHQKALTHLSTFFGTHVGGSPQLQAQCAFGPGDGQFRPPHDRVASGRAERIRRSLAASFVGTRAVQRSMRPGHRRPNGARLRSMRSRHAFDGFG